MGGRNPPLITKNNMKNKGMYRTIVSNSSIKVNNSYEGEPIEKKVERFVNGQEPITDGAPLIYTDRKDGVEAQYNIRTDRFEIGLEAMDYVTKSARAKTVQMYKNNEEGNVSNEPTQATNDKQ